MAKFTILQPEVLFATAVAFLGGGLAGAVFNWYVNRPEPTVVTYNVTTTSAGSSGVKSAVPRLRIQIGDEEIPVVYSNSVEFSVVRGTQIDSADVAITAPTGVRIFGFSSEEPSPIHHVKCIGIQGGIVCTLSPLAQIENGKYRVTLATDQQVPFSVVTSTKNLRLSKLDDFLKEDQLSFEALFSKGRLPKTLVLITVGVVYIFGLSMFLRRFRRFIYGLKQPLVVGKVLDSSGIPVQGATIELDLNSPRVNYSPVVTDRLGDFIFGSARKISLFAGHARIVHPNYESADIKVESPIFVCTLKKASAVADPDRIKTDDSTSR